MTQRRGFDPVLLLCFLALFVIQAPWLRPDVVPIHDTFYNFVNFYVFYAHLFLEGGLVQWYPYGVFGLPAALQQVISFTPVEYGVALGGALLRVRDAMLLFEIAVVAEQMVFVLGMVLLARRIFRERATVLVIGLAAAGSVVWYAQIWFELRFFYLFPLVLHLAIGFLDEPRAERFWLAGLACVAWAMGNVPYFASVWGLVLLLVLAGPAFARRTAWREVVPRSARGVLTMVAFFVAAGLFAYLGLGSLDGVVMREEGRDPTTGQVPLVAFLTWGGNADLRTLARGIAFGWPPQLPWGSGVDTSAYVGLLPLAGLAVALVRERSRLFFGLVAAIVFLVCFSYGGVVTRLAYSLPTFSGYRHVGLVYGLVKVLVLVAAGFGLERFAARMRMPETPLVWLALGAAILGAFAAGRAFTWEWAEAWPLAVGIRVVVYLALGAASLAATRSLALGMLVALAFDLGLYQAAVLARAPRLPSELAATVSTFRVAPLPYRPQREREPDPVSPLPEDVRTRDATALVARPGAMEVYWHTHGFTHFDPCESPYYKDMWTHRVYQLLLLEKRQGIDVGDRTGCTLPKLRVVSGATLFDSPQDARAAVIAMAGGPHAPEDVRDVIRIPPGVPRPDSGPPRAVAGRAEVTRFTPDTLEATVEVDTAEGAWLIYADAADPGWRAAIDGVPTRIYEANLAFKALRVPAGVHVVRFAHRRGLHLLASHGVALFGLVYAGGLAAVAVGACFPRRAPELRRPAPPPVGTYSASA